ncbi:DUF6221 family protein [Streptomyces mexicanus]|uniref:DUF6221 family protein n=1 Tax=Streptomyces mexicanus TaxID=178566 RepID=UPI003648CA4B
MDDLVQWLRAQLDEDERVARLALDQTGDNWRAYYKQIIAANPRFGEDPADANTSEVADHIARHDPTRVLAEVEAKRQVIEQYESIGNPPPSEIGPDLVRAELGRVLRLLALPYADRPGYREEWRP